MGGQQLIPHISAKRATLKSETNKSATRYSRSPDYFKQNFRTFELNKRSEPKKAETLLKNNTNIVHTNTFNLNQGKDQAHLLKILNRNQTSFNIRNQQTCLIDNKMSHKLDLMKGKHDTDRGTSNSSSKRPKSAMKGQFYRSKIKTITLISNNLPIPICKDKKTNKHNVNSYMQNKVMHVNSYPKVIINKNSREGLKNLRNKINFESFSQSLDQNQQKSIINSKIDKNLKKGDLKINIKLIECTDQQKNNQKQINHFSQEAIQKKSIMEEGLENKIHELETNFLNMKFDKNNLRRRQLFLLIKKSSISSDNLKKNLNDKRLNRNSPEYQRKNEIFDEIISSNPNNIKMQNKKPLSFFKDSIFAYKKIDEDIYQPNPENLYHWCGENGPFCKNNSYLKTYYNKVKKK